MFLVNERFGAIMSPKEIVVNVEVLTETVTFSARVPCASPGHEWQYCRPKTGQRYVDHLRRLCVADMNFVRSWFLTEVPSWIAPDWIPPGWVFSNGRGRVFWEPTERFYQNGEWVVSRNCVNISELLTAWNHEPPRFCGDQAIWEIKPKAAVV